jgi:hypothetical protein
MTESEFITIVKQATAHVISVVPFSHAPALCRHDYWLWRVAYETDTTALFFDWTPTTDRCLDIWIEPVIAKDAKFNLHTYLRTFDPVAARDLGASFAKDQKDMTDLLQFYVKAILKHRETLFDDPRATAVALKRTYLERNLANQPFRPSGRFCYEKKA